MKLSELSPAAGSTFTAKRKGRGHGSGNGKTAGKGHKGQIARSGHTRIGFEGGQMPLSAVNVSALNRFEDGATVNAQALLESGVLSKCEYGVKILGNGELTKKLTVQASAFSASAKEKIEAAGGKAEVI